MFDVYVVDLDHPRDEQGRVRMRVVADSFPESSAAIRAGRCACLEMLESAGAIDVARIHVVSPPAYPNTNQLITLAMSLGAPFTDMARFWVQDQADGSITEHVPTVAELAEVHTGQRSQAASSAMASALGTLASIAHGRSSSLPALRVALQFFAALQGEDWLSLPMPFEVRSGIGIGWRHSILRRSDTMCRQAGSYSAVVTGQRVIFSRTRKISITTESSEFALDGETPRLIADYFHTGRLPGEQLGQPVVTDAAA